MNLRIAFVLAFIFSATVSLGAPNHFVLKGQVPLKSEVAGIRIDLLKKKETRTKTTYDGVLTLDRSGGVLKKKVSLLLSSQGKLSSTVFLKGGYWEGESLSLNGKSIPQDLNVGDIILINSEHTLHSTAFHRAGSTSIEMRLAAGAVEFEVEMAE